MPYSFVPQDIEDTGLYCDFSSEFLDGDEDKVQPVKREFPKDYQIDDGQEIGSVIEPGLVVALKDAVVLDTTYIPTKKKLFPNKGPVEVFFKSLPCFVPREGLHYMACEAFKNMVEELEPAVHQFFPIDLYGPDDKLYTRRYHFQVLNRVAFVDKEKSVFELYGGRLKAGNNGYGPIYYDDEAVRGLHMWRDRYYGGHIIFVSDILGEKMIEAGFKGMELRKVKESPYPVPEKYLEQGS